MDALLEAVEVEPVTVGVGHDDLAVDDASLGQRVEQLRDQLREVAVERALVAARQLDLVAVTEDDAAEAVPLRLVEQAVSRRDRPRQLRQHRQDRRHHRELHPAKSARMATLDGTETISRASVGMPEEAYRGSGRDPAPPRRRRRARISASRQRQHDGDRGDAEGAQHRRRAASAGAGRNAPT